MKTTLILLMTLLLTAGGCTKEDHKDTKQENSIYGTWKLVETSGSDGGSDPTWSSVDNGYTYIFLNNGDFITSKLSNCIGKFTSTNNSLEINFDCNENEFIWKYHHYELKNNELILISFQCDEGCGKKFKKIQTQIKN